MTNTPMTSREAFEKWLEQGFSDPARNAIAWKAWQASQAQQAIVIAELRQSIERLGEMANICIYNELGKVCSTCNCKRAISKGE